MSKLIAIDYGKKKTGIAETDDMQIIASGLTTVDTTQLLVYLQTYFEKNSVEKVIVGEPKQMDGK